MKKFHTYSYTFFTVLLISISIQITILAISPNNLELLGDPFVFISFPSVTHTSWLFTTTMISLVTSLIVGALHWKE